MTDIVRIPLDGIFRNGEEGPTESRKALWFCYRLDDSVSDPADIRLISADRLGDAHLADYDFMCSLFCEVGEPCRDAFADAMELLELVPVVKYLAKPPWLVTVDYREPFVASVGHAPHSPGDEVLGYLREYGPCTRTQLVCRVFDHVVGVQLLRKTDQAIQALLAEKAITRERGEYGVLRFDIA